MSKWFRTGVAAVALLIAVLLQMETLTHVLGVMLAVMLWLSVGSYFPKMVSDYSKAQKVIAGMILAAVVIITAWLVQTVM